VEQTEPVRAVPELNIVFFASLRDVVGLSSMTVNAGDLQALNNILRSQLSLEAQEQVFAENVRIARNQELLDDPDVCFNQGDEIAFLPPVTGG
jgi:molybdopterin converting factor small subunit